MKKYFGTAAYISVSVSLLLGYVIYMIRGADYLEIEKINLLIGYLATSFFIYVVVDYFAVKRIPFKTSFDIQRSRKLKIFIFETVVILIAGFFVYSRYEISGAIKFILFPAVINIFIGAIYESIRQLRSKE